MANTEALAGTHSYVIYGEESTYNTAVAGSTNLGLVQSVRANINSNLAQHRSFVGTTSGGRQVAYSTPGVLDLSLSTDFKVTRWHFMKYVLGGESGGGPYTYTPATTLPSVTLRTNIDNPGSTPTDQELTWSGSVVDQCTIRCAVGEEVRASIDWKAALVVLDTTISSSVALPSEDPFNFTGGSVTIGALTVENIIDSVEVSIRNNVEMLAGLGSRLVQRQLAKDLEYSLKINFKYIDNDLVTAALGASTPTATGIPTENSTVVLTFAQGGRSLAMTFSGVPITEYAQMHELNNPIDEEITLTPKTLSCSDDRSP